MTRRLLAITLILMFVVAALAVPPDFGLKSAADLLNAGRADEAIILLGSHIKAKPQDAEAYNLLARTYYATGRWDEAVSAGEKAVALDPGNSAYHMWLGRTSGEKADHSSFVTAAGLAKKIRIEFERAVQLDTTNLEARTDLAEFYLEAPGFMGGGKNKARQQADEMARQDAAVAHWLEARIAEKDKRLADAESEYKAAIETSEYQARYWLNLASFFKRQHRYDDMEAAISSAVIRKYLTGGTTTEEAPAFKAHSAASSGMVCSEYTVFTWSSTASTTARCTLTCNRSQSKSPHCRPKISLTRSPKPMATQSIVRKMSIRVPPWRINMQVADYNNLQKTYSQLPDEELLRLCSDSGGLTDFTENVNQLILFNF